MPVQSCVGTRASGLIHIRGQRDIGHSLATILQQSYVHLVVIETRLATIHDYFKLFKSYESWCSMPQKKLQGSSWP